MATIREEVEARLISDYIPGPQMKYPCVTFKCEGVDPVDGSYGSVFYLPTPDSGVRVFVGEDEYPEGYGWKPKEPGAEDHGWETIIYAVKLAVKKDCLVYEL